MDRDYDVSIISLHNPNSTEAIKGAKDSWKDEWILILWSIPMIMIWIKPLQQFVEDGFIDNAESEQEKNIQ